MKKLLEVKTSNLVQNQRNTPVLKSNETTGESLPDQMKKKRNMSKRKEPPVSNYVQKNVSIFSNITVNLPEDNGKQNIYFLTIIASAAAALVSVFMYWFFNRP